MGGEVRVHSEGIGHGTTFIIKMNAISKIKARNDNSQSSQRNKEVLNQQIKAQRQALMISQSCNRKRKESAKSLNNFEMADEILTRLRVLVINDEYFILSMQQQMISQAKITDIDTA